MSQSLSPVTSPENAESSGRDVGDEEPVNYNATSVATVDTPGVDLEKAKQFLNKQLNVMSQLVRTSEQLERNSNITHGNSFLDDFLVIYWFSI